MVKKIDAHMHFSVESLKEALVTMDRNDIEFALNARIVDPTPGLEMIALTREIAGDRIASLSSFEEDDLDRIEEPGRVEQIVERFRREVDAGSKGFKVNKRLGLFAKYSDETWVRPDDERLDLLWAAAGEMSVPVLIHVADPIPNWLSLDENNPRAEMLRKNPRAWFGDGKHFDRLELLGMRDTVLARHPDTVFVNAHWGCYPEDLDHLVQLFETYPNFLTDTESGKVVLTPEGKQHPSRRDVLIRYADRTLFGTDLAYWAGRTNVDHDWNTEMYARQFRWFETGEDGGAALPEEVLKKIYHDNAMRVYHL